MKKILLFLNLMSMAIIAQDLQQFRDVAILLERGSIENYKNPFGGSISSILTCLIHDKNVPIIVEGAILHAVRKVWEIGRLNHKHSDFQDKFDDKYIEEAKFNFHEWQIYKHKKEDFYLLLPIEYVKLQPSSSNSSFVEDGFMLNNLQQIKSESELNNLLSKWEDGYSTVKSRLEEALSTLPFMSSQIDSNIEALKDFFVPQSGKWNIYLTGHGGYFEPKHFMLPRGMVLPGHICSLSAKRFSDFLSFCSQNINTFSLFISTCYGGQTNLEYVNKQMKYLESQKSPSFVLISACALDCVIYSEMVQTKAYFDKIRKNSGTLTKYFRPLNTISYEERQNLYRLIASIIRPAKGILETGSDDYKQIRPSNMQIYPALDERGDKVYLSSIRLPKWSSFRATSLDDRHFDLDEAIIERKEEINCNKSAVLVYSEDIPNDVNMNQVDTIFSMTPGASVHRFKTITTQKNIQDFLRVFANVLTPYKKVFLIDKLIADNEEYNDVVVYRNPKKLNFLGGIQQFEVEMLANKLGKEISVKLDLSNSENLIGKIQVAENQYRANITGKKTQLERKEVWIWTTGMSLPERQNRAQKILRLIENFRNR